VTVIFSRHFLTYIAKNVLTKKTGLIVISSVIISMVVRLL
jgi:hypothetical protein